MDLLARRDHSRLELARKLAARGFETDVVAATLDDLERDGLLQEARFVESFISGRIRKGQGPVRIRAELAQRGIDEAGVADGLAAVTTDWGELAAEVRAKRFGAESPADFKTRARQAKFLQYRGFEPEQIRAALDNAARHHHRT
jgi:regulatory protein